MGKEGVRSREQRGTRQRWDLNTPDQRVSQTREVYQAVAWRRFSRERKDMDKSKKLPLDCGASRY